MSKPKSRKKVIAELVAKHPAAKLAEMYLDAEAESGSSAAEKILNKVRKLVGKESASVGTSQIDKIIDFLRKHGDKANSAVIRNGIGISREDWKATVPDLKKHADIKMGSEKGQAKTYRIK